MRRGFLSSLTALLTGAGLAFAQSPVAPVERARVDTLPAMADMQWLDGGITAVPGILASGIAAGIKPSGKKDLALIYSSAPARAAAVFTSNQVKGAPVIVSQEHVRDGRGQAIVASSGCSNVCTGEQGVKDAQKQMKAKGMSAEQAEMAAFELNSHDASRLGGK